MITLPSLQRVPKIDNLTLLQLSQDLVKKLYFKALHDVSLQESFDNEVRKGLTYTHIEHPETTKFMNSSLAMATALHSWNVVSTLLNNVSIERFSHPNLIYSLFHAIEHAEFSVVKKLFKNYPLLIGESFIFSAQDLLFFKYGSLATKEPSKTITKHHITSVSWEDEPDDASATWVLPAEIKDLAPLKPLMVDPSYAHMKPSGAARLRPLINSNAHSPRDPHSPESTPKPISPRRNIIVLPVLAPE